MEIWIIRDGEKVGPIADYEVRRKIQTGELTREVPCWHEGLSSWRPLVEIPLFKDEFDWVQVGDLSAAPGAGDERSRGGPPPLPGPQVLGRRWWARLLDLQCYLAVWWLTLWACGCDLEAVLRSLLLLVLQLVPWFIVEAVMLHRWGTTPGKWLLGLRVTNVDGTPLTLPAALRRSFRILVGGIGFGWFPLALFCMGFSWFTVRRLGNPLWDHAGKHRVQSTPLAAWRITAVVMLFLLAIQLQSEVVGPAAIKVFVETFPAFKETVEQNLR